jgi:streptogramin lyase
MRLGAAAVGSMAGTPAEFIRRKHHVQHGSQDFNVHVIDTGPVVFAQAGKEPIYRLGLSNYN